MSDTEKMNQTVPDNTLKRRSLLSGAIAGIVAALTGCRPESPSEDTEARLSDLEARVSQLERRLASAGGSESLAQLEGEMNERVVFNKSELTITNPEGVLLNLVATDGHVGIRFYKDFDFGNEKVTSPWHMGFIEGLDGYEGLAILRDWRFTAALWDKDGKLLLGHLDPHPPANDSASARLHVRGTLDEVQTIVEGSVDQAADIFQVFGGERKKCLAVNSAGQVVVGSQHAPKELVLHDTQDGQAYSLKMADGQLTVNPV